MPNATVNLWILPSERDICAHRRHKTTTSHTSTLVLAATAMRGCSVCPRYAFYMTTYTSCGLYHLLPTKLFRCPTSHEMVTCDGSHDRMWWLFAAVGAYDSLLWRLMASSTMGIEDLLRRQVTPTRVLEATAAACTSLRQVRRYIKVSTCRWCSAWCAQCQCRC